MFIVSHNPCVSYNKVTLVLQEDEVKQLIGYLEQLLDSEAKFDHHHLSDTSYKKEITVCMLKGNDISSLHPTLKAAIERDG
jgi:hypothetical protein